MRGTRTYFAGVRRPPGPEFLRFWEIRTQGEGEETRVRGYPVILADIGWFFAAAARTATLLFYDILFPMFILML